MLYSVIWPKAATVGKRTENFVQRVQGKHEIYDIFDRYFEGSIKSHEREHCAGGKVFVEYEMTLDASLPKQVVSLKNKDNKRLLIDLLSGTKTPASIHMVGEKECRFQHEETDLNIVACMKLLAH